MAHHGESLRRLVKRKALVEQLKEDFRRADLSAPDQALLHYVAQLTTAPASVRRRDVKVLREVGFDDRAILDIAQITSYFAFVTRMAAGLGVRLEGRGS